MTTTNNPFDAIIFDIDGTLSDPIHRLHLIKNNKPDWDAFYKKAALDLPKTHNIMVFIAFWRQFYSVPFYLITGRKEFIRKDTEKWLCYEIFDKYLSSNRHPSTLKDWPIELHMRPNDDNSNDDELKKNIVINLNLIGKNVMVVEDRLRVCKMWRTLPNFHCLQVTNGDF